ncbi:MAG TPA: metal ABC transporter permease [Caldilineaceae bacterium]|nr:metal ABC transporter permease [Caldilineaceae bacterium]
MSSTQIEIQLIAAVVAVACALPGVFLVLRRMALMSDAISHTVLLGIVLSFFAVQTLHSPLLILGAALMGVVTVALVELLSHTRLVKQDAAIGLVFPALFSIAVILISRFARGVHLDVDAVLLGELAFAPFDRMVFLGLDLPKALVVMSGVLLLNVVFIGLFYKELKLATFDAGLAATLGFSPLLLHYALMSLVSVTAVGAFDAVGSVLVVALMVTPAAAAYLLTDDLRRMLALSALIAVVSAIGGYWLARLLNANIAGSMATMTGGLFLLVLLFAPGRGFLALARRRARQSLEFAQTMLAIHLLQHEDNPAAEDETRLDHLVRDVRWAPPFVARVVRYAERNGAIQRRQEHLSLTEQGRTLARQAMTR